MAGVHHCKFKESFCFVCARYQKVRSRKPINDRDKENYKKAFKVNKLKNLNKPFAPNIMCGTCKSNLSGHAKSGDPLRFKRPAIWCAPQDEECFCCNSKQRYEAVKVKELTEKYSGKRHMNVFLPRYKTLPDDESDAVEETDSDSEQ